MLPMPQVKDHGLGRSPAQGYAPSVIEVLSFGFYDCKMGVIIVLTPEAIVRRKQVITYKVSRALSGNSQ